MKKKLLSLILSAALLCNMGVLSVFATEEAPAAPTVGASQQVCPECGGQNGAHQKGCPQDAVPEPDPEPEEQMVTGWQWVDEEEILTDGMLALPGASEQAPALLADVIALLPASILAQLEGEEEKTELTLAGWDCADYPEKGAYEGRYLFTARLPEGYLLSEEAPALEIAVELGGAELLAEPESIDMQYSGFVFANGIPIVIRANNGITSIYDENGNLLSGETDISGMSIFGGWYEGSHIGDTSVTIESGEVIEVYGGGYGSSLSGSTHIEIKGGTVKGAAFGGGQQDILTGDIQLSVTGGCAGWVYGGGVNAEVAGKATVTVGNGAQIWGQKITDAAADKGTVFGGGIGGSVQSTRVILRAADYGWAYGGGQGCNIAGGTHVQLEESPEAFAMICAGGNGGNISQTRLEVNGSIGETSQLPSLYGGGWGDTVGRAQIILRGDCNLSGGIFCAGSPEASGGTVEKAEILIEDWKLTGTYGTVCGTLHRGSVSGKVTVKVNGQRAPREQLQLYLQGMDEVLLQDTSVVLFASNEPDSDGKLSLGRLDIALSAQAVFAADNMAVEIERLSGSGSVVFESMNALAQLPSVSVGEIAAGTQLTLEPRGAGWDASRIENMVFFRGEGIDKLASADCFSAADYKVVLETLSNGKGIKLGERTSARKVAYISAMHFENPDYPYGGIMPVFVGVKSKDQNKSIPGAMLQIRRGTDYAVVASAQVDEAAENARITLPDGSQKTVTLAQDGTIRIDLPVNDLLYKMGEQRALQIYFPGNEEYAPAVYILSHPDAGGRGDFGITGVEIALQDEGIVSPVLGESPKTALSVAENAFYTAEIVWTPDTDTFRLHTPYSAGIRIVPKEGYSLNSETIGKTVSFGGREITYLSNSDGSITLPEVKRFDPLPGGEIGLSASPEEGGTVTGGGVYPADTQITVQAVPNEGWRFVKWEEDEITVSSLAEYAFTVLNDRTLTAVFEKIPRYAITVSASPAGGGSVTGGGSYIENSAVTVRAAANEGYRFLRWEENGRPVSTNPEYTFTASENRTLSAVFQKLPEPPAAEKESKTELGALSEVPEGLKNTAFDTVEKIMQELTRKITVQPGYTAENFSAYDVQLLISLDGGKSWQSATEKDFPARGITVILPYPQGTGRQTHDFTVTHMFTLTSARLGTTAGETEQPPVEKTEEGLKVTFHGLSPVGIAWKAVEEGGEDKPPVVTPTGSGKGGSSKEKPEDEYSFWKQVKRQIEEAQRGETVRINVQDYKRMPLSVMKALRDRPDVTLVIRRNDGKPITIPAGRALWEERRSYYPLSYLEGYNFNGPGPKSSAAHPEKENPGTGAPEKIR